MSLTQLLAFPSTCPPSVKLCPTRHQRLTPGQVGNKEPVRATTHSLLLTIFKHPTGSESLVHRSQVQSAVSRAGVSQLVPLQDTTHCPVFTPQLGTVAMSLWCQDRLVINPRIYISMLQNKAWQQIQITSLNVPHPLTGRGEQHVLRPCFNSGKIHLASCLHSQQPWICSGQGWAGGSMFTGLGSFKTTAHT